MSVKTGSTDNGSFRRIVKREVPGCYLSSGLGRASIKTRPELVLSPDHSKSLGTRLDQNRPDIMTLSGQPD